LSYARISCFVFRVSCLALGVWCETDGTRHRSRSLPNTKHETRNTSRGQAMIFVTTPEPTVRPPSRMAKRRPSSMATGMPSISSTVTFTLSPGMHISTPAGSATLPVTSVVRK